MEKVAVDKIDTGERIREDYGDLESLAKNIKSRGQRQPIEVVRKENLEDFDRFDEPESGFDDEKPFLLIAGGRRFFSIETLLGWDEIKAETPESETINEVEYRERELEENLQRKELSWEEEVQAKDRLHRLKTQKYGRKLQGQESTGDPEKDGWSQADTAEHLGESEYTTSKDLSLAEDLKDFPEVAEEASTKSQARNMVNKKKEKQKRKQHAEEMREKEKDGEDEEMKERLCKRYIVGDFFELADELPQESFDIVEMDPPYGINFDKMVDGSFGRAPSETVYQDIDDDDLDRFMSEAARKAYNLLKPDSWLIFWMSGQYINRSRAWLEDAGFSLPKIPAIWHTLSGRCRAPKHNLAHDSEFFWYARKGNAQVTPREESGVGQGRSNIFVVQRIKHSARYHDNQAPIKLYEKIFRTFTSSGDSGLSAFAGSGSAILAGHNVGVDTIGIDIDAQDQYKDSFESKVWDGDLGNYSDE